MRVALVVLALLAAASAQAGVRVVPPFDPADYADRAAVGLLVPGAGPTVTHEAALAALLRGKLEHGLLGGIAAGENKIELGAPGGREILVSLPPPGRSDNDVRYQIALLGERGLLTSDSTRIDGLVSVTDIATGRLRVVENDDPAQALEELDDRIDRNSEWRLPLTIALAALLIALAFMRPRYALRALLVALAANLWLSPLLAVAAGVAVLFLPLGWACGAILLAYLVSMGLDAETVALSPFGPSQSGRFYGINNLLETMLLAPALLGAALLGRAAERRRFLEAEARALGSLAPDIGAARQRAADLLDRGSRSVGDRIERRRMTLDAARDVLRTLSPAATLERGYAVALLHDGAILREAGDARAGDALHVVLARGTVDARVEGSRPDGAEELLR